jgi:hypothetical protein
LCAELVGNSFFHQITNVGQNLSGRIHIFGWLLVNNLGGKEWVDNGELVLVVWFLLQSELKIISGKAKPNFDAYELFCLKHFWRLEIFSCEASSTCCNLTD